MKKLLALSCFLASCFVGYGTLVIREHISFDHNSAYLTKQARRALENIIPQESGWMVEKIDIEGHCDYSGQSHYNLELSKERAFRVYEFLSEIFPDRGDYEIRYVGEDHPVSMEDPERNRCVLVSVYLLELDVPKQSHMPQMLFPEEFPDFVLEEEKEEEPRAAESQPVLDQPISTFIPQDFEADTKFEIENVYFYGNSAVYRQESETSLEELAAFMHYNTGVEIMLEGHVNGNMGRRYLKKAAESNPERKAYKNAEHLSLERAETVKSFLVNEGIDEDRIVCVGKGGSEKIYKNPSNQSENRANRRIEVIILNK